ncbi:MAG: oxygen-independent coproporphyrinogen III oxidase [Planctomycetes bacterium]|nr:oxygen-independent coproporphyrinogen III oxidase [Planctomycetota bacterium]
MTEVNLDVFRKYAGLSLPRHVSYPMPTGWQDLDGQEAAAMHGDSRRAESPHDLSLYLHIPFCEALCKFCACNRVIQPKARTGAADTTESYLAALQTDIGRVAESVGTDRPLRQIHWGGGSPTYLTEEQIEKIHRSIEGAFALSPETEIAMELDPRGTTPSLLGTLYRLGFRRMSMGVQDFDRAVQEHIHRIQPFEMVRDVVTACRDAGFCSINFDLIYGMPYQTPDTIRDTVERTITLSPDRVAYYHYAQIPEKIATQRGMDHTKMPDSETKLEMFLIGAELLEAAGYEFIGLDHFARPDEGLALAARSGTLQRNFQGMTTGAGLDLIGAGVSSISNLVDVGFIQNVKETQRYVELIEAGDSPAERGKRLTFDDQVRQAVISQLYCGTSLQPRLIEQRFDIDFGDYFARELGIMQELEADGLVSVDSDGTISVTWPLGRVLLRTVAAVFDAYLDPEAYRVGDRRSFSTNA